MLGVVSGVGDGRRREAKPVALGPVSVVDARRRGVGDGRRRRSRPTQRWGRAAAAMQVLSSCQAIGEKSVIGSRYLDRMLD
jgi:hypothetical protein